MMSKTCVVVGASKGIGKEIVLQLAAHSDYQIIALARSESVLNLFQNFSNVKAYQIDLQSKNLKTELNDIFSPFEQIDVLINNAGYLVSKPFTELTEQDFQESYQTNILSVFITVQCILPKMQHSGGHIVNISSMGGFQGSIKFPGLTAYSTSKAALVSFTELFAEEYKDSKINMNCLCLGAAQTEMLEQAFPGYKAPLSAEEMANYIVDFALNGNKWFNGKIIPVSLSTP